MAAAMEGKVSAKSKQAQRELERAIALVKAGDRASASAKLRAVIAAPDLDDAGRSAAWLWLAETGDDSAFRADCLRHAARLQPDNKRIRSQLNRLARATSSGVSLEHAPAVVGVGGGRNGMGSGVFVDSDGTVATTAYVVGGARRMQLMIKGMEGIACEVARRFPEADLALLKAPVTIRDGIAQRSEAELDSGAFTSLSYGGSRSRGAAQAHNGANGSAWLRTTLPLSSLPDAGGLPLYAGGGEIIGLLTRNVDAATGMCLAVPFRRVRDLAQRTAQELAAEGTACYCAACGTRSRAGRFGGRYCEICGAPLPPELVRQGEPDADRLAQLHGEDRIRPCPNCASPARFYAGSCLRCGMAIAIRETS